MPIGIDIVKIERIALTDKFINMVLSEEEQDLLDKKPNKKEFLAGRFAAKEAFLKANGKGLGEMNLNEIKVLYKENSTAPFISYGGVDYPNVSIAHEKDYAVAIVLL